MQSKEERNRTAEAIVNRWNSEESQYKELEQVVADFLKSEITKSELLPVITHRTKELSSLIKTAAKKNKSYDEFVDKLGFRIICHLKSELPIIKQFLEKFFIIHNFESKAENLDFNKLAYVSDHYDVSVRPDIEPFLKTPHLHRLRFEIQSRTICQHAWADVDHSLRYKREDDLPDQVKRKIYRLTTLFELCDDEFQTVSEILLALPETIPFAILHVLEKKFYKYAKRHFDPEISLETITLLIKGLNLTEDLKTFHSALTEFMENRQDLIEHIFIERKDQLDSDFYLSQPEVILIWFLLENRKQDLIVLWRKNHDFEDLKDLGIMWGISLE